MGDYCGGGAKCAAMAWTWRPEDLFLETLKDSARAGRPWRGSELGGIGELPGDGLACAAKVGVV